MKNHFSLFLVIPLLVACSQSDSPEPTAPATAIVLPSNLKSRIAQDNEFAFDLLKSTINNNVNEDNVFISPLSVSIALAMARNGAVGDTKTEMNTALKLSGLSDSQINEYYKIMQNSLLAIDPSSKLSVANSIWYKMGFTVKPDFLQTSKDYFNSEVRQLDFTQPSALETINNWCAQKTNDLIKKPLDVIPSNAIMYLINAIYFKGIWQKQFDKKATAEKDFYSETGAISKVNMMNLADTIPYFANDLLQAIDLPYGNGAFSMTLLLPKSGKTTADILSTLNLDQWNNLLGNLKEQKVGVYLPRFTSKNKFEFKPVMQDLGMKLAFTDLADFTSIANESLLISKITHSTYLDVNEEGTEAAAATIVEIIFTSVGDQPLLFNANKPFILTIREKSTGAILFVGKIGKPGLN
jgi:serpin B